MISKQAMLGTGVFLGGSVLLYAMIHQISHSPTNTASTPPTISASQTAPVADSTTPLTADIATEQRILAEKQKEREARVAQQDREAQAYMNQQQQVESQALAKSRAENQQYANKNNPPPAASPVISNAQVTTVTPTTTTTPAQATQPSTPVTQPVVTTRNQTVTETERPQTSEKVEKPENHIEAKADKPKPRPSSYQVQPNESLSLIADTYGVPVSVLAQANKMSTGDSLSVGQHLRIPSPAQVKHLQQEAAYAETVRQNKIKAAERAEERKKAREEKLAQAKARQQEIKAKQAELKAEQAQKRKENYQAAQQKLREARLSVKEREAKGTFGVQVALAADSKRAQSIVERLQSAGYRVKTSKTSRGTRIVVGPEKGKEAALALKDKINSDARVGTGNAWVLYW